MIPISYNKIVKVLFMIRSRFTRLSGSRILLGMNGKFRLNSTGVSLAASNVYSQDSCSANDCNDWL